MRSFHPVSIVTLCLAAGYAWSQTPGPKNHGEFSRGAIRKTSFEIGKKLNPAILDRLRDLSRKPGGTKPARPGALFRAKADQDFLRAYLAQADARIVSQIDLTVDAEGAIFSYHRQQAKLIAENIVAGDFSLEGRKFNLWQFRHAKELTDFVETALTAPKKSRAWNWIFPSAWAEGSASGMVARGLANRVLGFLSSSVDTARGFVSNQVALPACREIFISARTVLKSLESEPCDNVLAKGRAGLAIPFSKDDVMRNNQEIEAGRQMHTEEMDRLSNAMKSGIIFGESPGTNQIYSGCASNVQSELYRHCYLTGDYDGQGVSTPHTPAGASPLGDEAVAMCQSEERIYERCAAAWGMPRSGSTSGGAAPAP